MRGRKANAIVSITFLVSLLILALTAIIMCLTNQRTMPVVTDRLSVPGLGLTLQVKQPEGGKVIVSSPLQAPAGGNSLVPPPPAL
jgi:hypothetical protein